MNYPELMQKSIDFIEQNLTSDICVEDAAREAACSLYHYHRVFTALVGITPGEYIRKRRFSCAVHDILFTGDRVLDIAAKYGYESPESFTRAFRKAYGQPPSIARRIHSELECFGAVDLNESRILKIIGGINVNYSIIEKQSFLVAGKGLVLGNDIESNQKRIPAFWDKVCSERCIESILNERLVNPGITLGICLDFTEIGEFTYFIGVEVDKKEDIPDGLEIKEIPSAKYAVFTAKGPLPGSVQQALGEIYGNWFPSSDYERAEKPDFEWYDISRMKTPETTEVDLYIPVK